MLLQVSCTAGLAGTFNYQIFQWVNPANQCVTVNYTGTNASFGFVTVHNAPPTLTNLCANWVADPGSSATNGGTITFSFNGTAGTTYYFFVTNVGATPSNCTIEIDAPVCSSVPCTGTPAPGMTMSSVPTVCPGTNFNLSLQNPTAGAGVSYVWESGPSMTGPWTVIAGAPNSTLTRNQTAATYYRCTVTCGGNSGTSTPVLVALTPPSGCYCIPPAVNCTDDDEIIRVQISTLDNASGCSTGPPAGYADYTTTVAAPDVQAGAPNTITVSYNTIWSKSGAVWIDYNQNGQFEANEYTSTGSGAGSVAQLIANINIPGNALSGVTRMRVRTRFGTAGFLPTAACTNPSGFGETEDYNVNILPCVPVVITASPVNRTIQCSGTTTFSTTTTGTNPTFQWEFRPNATTPWQFVTNGGIYSGATTSTLTLDNVSQAFNGYQYRAVVIGGCSATDFTALATLTVGPLIATVTPTSANICTGTIQKLTLTNASSPSVASFASPAALGLALPDGNVAGANHSINVSGIPAGSVLTRVDVKMNVTHGWVADLEVVLKAPNGQVLNLSDLVSGTNQSGANFTNTVFSSAGLNAISTGTRPGYTGIFKADAIPGPTGAFGVPAGPTGFLPTTTTW